MRLATITSGLPEKSEGAIRLDSTTPWITSRAVGEMGGRRAFCNAAGHPRAFLKRQKPENPGACLGRIQPGARYLDLHLAEASQQRSRPVAVAMPGGTDRARRLAARRLRMASVARPRQCHVELALDH